MKSHGLKYSQTYKKGFGLWADNFESMAIKTVIKLLLSKYAPLSIEMQRAVLSDQSIINNHETEDITYVDNEIQEVNKASERVTIMIGEATTINDLEKLGEKCDMTPEQIEIFNTKKAELKNGRK